MRKLNRLESVIVLQYELFWKNPVQAYSIFKNRYGEVYIHHWFSEWDSIEGALFCIQKNHSEEIIIDLQIKFGSDNSPQCKYR